MHNNKFCKIEMRAFFMYGIGSRLLDSSLLRQGQIISCSSLLESTEMKIAGKRRVKLEWSSQTGAARMEQGQSQG